MKNAREALHYLAAFPAPEDRKIAVAMLSAALDERDTLAKALEVLVISPQAGISDNEFGIHCIYCRYSADRYSADWYDESIEHDLDCPILQARAVL